MSRLSDAKIARWLAEKGEDIGRGVLSYKHGRTHRLDPARCPEGGYVIASGSWMPGHFDTEEAARCGLHLSDEDIEAIQGDGVPPKTITLEMIRAFMDGAS